YPSWLGARWGRIVESDVKKFDTAAASRRRQRARAFRFGEDRLRIEHVEQTRHRRRAALEQVDHPPERDERPGEHAEVETKRDEAAHGERSAQHERAADA